MVKKEKSTGWRVPLLFSAGIIVFIALAWWLVGPKESEIQLPPEMVRHAGSVKLDLDGPEGSAWKKRVVDAASGFGDYAAKDGALARVAGEALAAGRYDAACLALALMKNDEARRKLAGEIFKRGKSACETLAYAIFAIRAHGGPEEAKRMLMELMPQWESCLGSF